MNEKLELYKVRDFGERINVTFSFIKQNAKPIFKNLLYLVPVYLFVAIIMGLYIGSFYTNMMSTVYSGMYYYDTDFWTMYLVMMLLGIITSVTSMIAVIFVISYTAEYEESADGIVEIPKVWRRVKKSFWGILFGGILSGIAIVIGLMFCFIPGIWIGVSLSVFMPAYIVERNKEIYNNVFDAMSESFSLIKQDWFGAFGYLIVVGLIMMAFSFALTVPLQIVQTSAGLFHTNGIFYIIILILVYTLSNLGSLFFSAISSTAISILYYDFKERRDGLSMQKRIEDIGQQQQF